MESGQNGASELLHASASMPARHQARVDALSHFPLSTQVWRELGPKVVNLVEVEEVPPDTPEWHELVRTAAELPLDRSVKPSLWRTFVDDDLSIAPSQAIDEQLDQLAKNPKGAAAEALAGLPIEEHGVTAELHHQSLPRPRTSRICIQLPQRHNGVVGGHAAAGIAQVGPRYPTGAVLMLPTSTAAQSNPLGRKV